MLRCRSLLALPFLLLPLAACAAESEDAAGEAASAATPTPKTNVFEQLATCENLLKQRAAYRDADLEAGIIPWKCGDVDKVTISSCENDLDKLARAEQSRRSTSNVDVKRRESLYACGDGYGQEYCEYNAVAKGAVVNSVAAGRSLGARDVVQCVFTSIHSDVGGGFVEGEAYATTVASGLKDQLTNAARVPEHRVGGMRQEVNSRVAADMLVQDCSALASDDARAKDAERQTRCYRAWLGARTQAAKNKLERACKGVDLSVDANWAKTRLDESGALADADVDLAACSMILFAANGGVAWRNSDPTICARSYRATRECNVPFKRIGDVAPDFKGFSMHGWANQNTLPGPCVYGKIDGVESKNLVICTPPAAKVAEYRTAVPPKPLQMLCRDLFGVGVAMNAPIGALADVSAAKTDTPFCKALVSGAQKAQAPAREVSP